DSKGIRHIPPLRRLRNISVRDRTAASAGNESRASPWRAVLPMRWPPAGTPLPSPYLPAHPCQNSSTRLPDISRPDHPCLLLAESTPSPFYHRRVVADLSKVIPIQSSPARSLSRPLLQTISSPLRDRSPERTAQG